MTNKNTSAVPGTDIDTVNSRRIVANWPPRQQQHTAGIEHAFKPKKAGNKNSHVILVLDNSISMKGNKLSTISGYNEYLDSQKEDAKRDNIPTYFSLYIFGGGTISRLHDRVKIEDIPHLDEDSYNPNGSSTNLNDGIGSTMMSINSLLAEKKKKNRDSIVITILTDGNENSSTVFSSEAIKSMTEKAEAKNWGFIFLGANIDAFAVGSQYGFRDSNTIQFNADAAAGTLRSVSAMTSRMKVAYASNLSTYDTYDNSAFSEMERKVAVTKDE